MIARLIEASSESVNTVCVMMSRTVVRSILERSSPGPISIASAEPSATIMARPGASWPSW